MGTRCADHVTPLYPQKLALTSPTGGGRSVGIDSVRTKATEFSLVFMQVTYGALKRIFRPERKNLAGRCFEITSCIVHLFTYLF